MSSSTSGPSEGDRKADDALPSGPDVIVQRIDPATASPELQSVLLQIADDMRRRTGGNDAVADVQAEGETIPESTQNQPETRLVERPTILKDEFIALFDLSFANTRDSMRIFWNEAQKKLPETINSTNYHASLNEISSSCFCIREPRIKGENFGSRLTMILNGGKSLHPDTEDFSSIASTLNLFESSMHANFAQLQERLGITTVSSQGFLKGLKTLANDSRDNALRTETAIQARSVKSVELERSIVRLYNEFNRLVPDRIDFLQARVICTNAIRTNQAILTTYGDDQVDRASFRERLLVDLLKFSAGVNMLLFEQFPDAPSKGKEFSLKTNVSGMPSADSISSTEEDVRLVSDMADSAETGSEFDSSSANAQVSDQNLLGANVENPQQPERILMTQEDVFALIADELPKSFPFVPQLTAIQGQIAELRTQCEGQPLRSLLEALSYQCCNFQLRARNLDIQDRETKRLLCSEQWVKKSGSTFGTPILDESRKREIFFQRICVVIQERMGLHTVECTVFAATLDQHLKSLDIPIRERRVGNSVLESDDFQDMASISQFRISMHEYFPQRLDVSQAAYFYGILHTCLRAMIHSAGKIDSLTSSMMTKQVEAFAAEIDSILIKQFPHKEIYDVENSPSEHSEQLERKSMTKQEIIDLCIQKMSATSLNSSLLTLDQRTLRPLLEQCPEIIDETSYEQLFRLSHLCLNTSIRLQSADFDPDIKKSMNGGVVISEARVHPHNLDECRQRELAYQAVFSMIQERLNIHTVNSALFNSRLATLKEGVMGSMDVIQERPTKKGLQHIPVLQALIKYYVSYWKSLPQGLDVLLARRVCEDVLNRALTENEIIRKVLPRHAVSAVTLAADLRMKFDELLDAEFPSSADTGLEGVGPLSREVFCNAFCDVISRASFFGTAEVDLEVERSRDAIQGQCPDIISCIQDLHKFLLWFATQMALLRKDARNEAGEGYSLELAPDDEIAVHFAPIFKQIGDKFGMSNFGLNAVSINSIAETTGTSIPAGKAKGQVLNVLKQDSISSGVRALAQSISPEDIAVQQKFISELNDYIQELRNLITQFFLTWLPEGIRSINDSKMVGSLITSSVGEIMQCLERPEYNNQGSSPTINFWEGILDKLTKVYELWETSLHTSASTSVVQTDSIDTPAWHANKTLAHPLPEGAEPTWESGRLTHDYLMSSMEALANGARDNAQLRSDLDVSGGGVQRYMHAAH